MTRTARIWLIASSLTALLTSPALADTVQTISGETISGRETTIFDGLLIVPAAGDRPEQKFKLSELEKITISPGKPVGALKTRFVRFELPGAGKQLSLAEVQLFEGDKNIASTGKPRQALSYQDDDELWGPQKAIDGKTGGDSRVDGVTRTITMENAWWELEFPKDVLIRKLVVFNRTDANLGPKLSGCRVQFLNERRQVLWTKTLDKAPNPKSEFDVPVHSDKLSADETKAIESIGVVTGTPPLASIVDAWIRDAKTTEPAAQPAAGAAPTATRRLGGLSAEAPPTVTASAGATPPSAAFPDGEWLVRFEPGGFLVGKITSWNDKGCTVEFNLDRKPKSITIPTETITEVSSRDIVLKKLPLDRTQIAAEGDTVFARAEGNALQAVSGVVKGIDGESLQFEFQGKVRSIKLAKVAAIMRKATAPQPARGQVIGVVELSNAMRLPGNFQSLSDSAGVLAFPWNQTADLNRVSIKAITVQNGRSLPLTDLEPSQVVYTPFLDRVLPYRKHESLTGNPLAVGDKKFERGLCAHSGTTLVYDLAGGYEKLRLQIGLQKDDGARGQAVVRIKADDALLAEKPIGGKAAAEALDLSLVGKKSLVIEIDYGDGLDVGDHVVLGDPVLVRAL